MGGRTGTGGTFGLTEFARELSKGPAVHIGIEPGIHRSPLVDINAVIYSANGEEKIKIKGIPRFRSSEHLRNILENYKLSSHAMAIYVTTYQQPASAHLLEGAD